MPPRRLGARFLAVNTVVWALMVVILVLVPDTLEPWTGLEIGRLEFACRYCASPGGTSEQVDVYVAEVRADTGGGIFGVAHEDEDIRTHIVPAARAFEMVRDGRIIAANSVIPLLWLQLHRERLIREWRRAAA